MTAGPDCVVRDLRGAVPILPPVDPLVVLLRLQSDGVFPGGVLVVVINVVTDTGPLLLVLQDNQVSSPVPSTAIISNLIEIIKQFIVFYWQIFCWNSHGSEKGTT